MGKRLSGLIASVCGIGYLPGAPGTYAAGISAIIWFLIADNKTLPVFQFGIVLLLIVTGIYFSGKMSTEKEKDPSYIVIDEVAGMWVTLLLIPPSFITYLIGFIAFRFFDIAKPLGIRKMEKGRNGWGVMLDDILAGIYSNVLLRILIALKLW
jgi:phosphatidylglycerophosphatase A